MIEKSILTTFIEPFPGYNRIQMWTDYTFTYTNVNGEMVPLTDKKAILCIINKMRDPSLKPFASIEEAKVGLELTEDLLLLDYLKSIE